MHRNPLTIPKRPKWPGRYGGKADHIFLETGCIHEKAEKHSWEFQMTKKCYRPPTALLWTIIQHQSPSWRTWKMSRYILLITRPAVYALSSFQKLRGGCPADWVCLLMCIQYSSDTPPRIVISKTSPLATLLCFGTQSCFSLAPCFHRLEEENAKKM